MSGTTSFDRNREETLLAEYLVEEVIGRAAGRLQDECLYNPPRDVYFIGNLRPRPDVDAELDSEPAALRELKNKLAPVAFGADFRVRPDEPVFDIAITLAWNCYYRIFPTLDRQCHHQKRRGDDSAEEETPNPLPTVATESSAISETGPAVVPAATDQTAPAEDAEDGSVLAEAQEQEEARVEAESPEATVTVRDRQRTRQSKDSLFIRFRKISCRATGRVQITLGADGWGFDLSNLQAALDAEMLRAQQVALADTERVRGDGDPASSITVPETALASEAAYTAFLQSLTIPIVPEWRWQAELEIRLNESGEADERVLQFAFVNITPTQTVVTDSLRRRDNPNIEPFLFDTQASFEFTRATVLPFELELAPRGFRYNRDLWGRGFNCAVERTERESDSDIFSTTHTPVSRQMRYTTRNNPPANFANLANEPLQQLEAIASAMDEYLNQWREQRAAYVSANPNWETQFGSSFNQDQQQFENEITDFRRGLQLIRDDEDVRLAFQLTNETFRRAGDHPTKPKTSWRLFQIVFLVSQIPGIAALKNPASLDAASREQVDIIYFPTGGGKTEAYLATLIFHCFFDRLRGKSAGVTAWTRFPLRLLTLQQTQRVADVIGMAELLRKEQSDARLSGKGVAGFAVGYFVGKEATPNEIVNPDRCRYENQKTGEVRAIWSQANDAQVRQNWKRIITCPSCRTKTVQVDFDADSVRVIHRCRQANCAFPKGRLPIYVVDNEIYRYLPSVVVGTIDKLASLGNQRKLAQVFGQVDGICQTHGYYKGKCCQKECDGKLLRQTVPSGLSGPTLFIQDELHLLKEGLGTFDAHYETFTQQLQRRFGQTAPSKIIASSATIEAFARQVEHLYGRSQARVFPGLGPTLADSFYAQTQQYPQRLFVGLLPHNKTIFNTILELIELYHRTVQDLQRWPAASPNPYGGSVDPSTPQWADLLDPYVTSLTYFLANRELDSIRTDLKGDVLPNLEAAGYIPIEPLDMTGGTSTDEVTRILDRLEQPGAMDRPVDAVLATSMISHGVDVDRLNAMIFYGMPRQTAEYIQASSRVGRAHVGIVFGCLHPARERDQSHYTYFAKYHEFIGQLIEPVAINRWAKFSLRRTAPGLFMATLLQLLSNSAGEAQNGGRYYKRDYVSQKISSGNIQASQFIPLLEAAYLVNAPSNTAEEDFRAEIARRVQMFLDQILNAGASCTWVSNALIPQPMTSLRDVDESLPIELDSSGSEWAARSNRP